MELFPKSNVAGVFRGFTEGGMEFHADLVMPYQSSFQNTPMHGQFLLVQLETAAEAVLGRITSFSSDGKLSSGYGEEFNIRAMRESREIPEDLREQYLKYRVNIRVLGVVRTKDGQPGIKFVPSHRRLPHVGSPVGFPSAEVLQELAGHNDSGATLGHYALGEYIYAQGAKDFKAEPWMQIKEPNIEVRFPIEYLVSRRSFIFARAGFGKSNLNKLLFSKLYEKTPTVLKGDNRETPVGTIIFDPDGEYFWPDDKQRPGLCDVPHLQDKVVVFTTRQAPSLFYQSFVAGGIKLDIRRLRPADVIALALSPERQEQQNVRKLKGLVTEKWERLVNLIDRHRNDADLGEIAEILSLKTEQETESLAARANMSSIVATLHDKTSQLMDMLLTALAAGKICVVDLSQMRGAQGLMLSGLILRRIFDRNQEEFTAKEPKTIPTIAVIEEAQSVLSDRASTTTEPFISWVKEGRKYDLGALMVTQQPGSIPAEILSQGDNWFIFHLLSAGDLTAIAKANAHFSKDILASLLNEPIPGQGVFWSSVRDKSFPVYLRVSSFERQYSVRDPKREQGEVETFARQLKREYEAAVAEVPGDAVSTPVTPPTTPDANGGPEEERPDPKEIYEARAIAALAENKEFKEKFNGEGIAWGRVVHLLEASLPDTITEKNNFAYGLVPKALGKISGGDQNHAWHSFRRPDGKSSVKKGPKPAAA